MSHREDDIKKYLRGELSPAERHALEKEALNDPFLADALEGAELVTSSEYEFDLNTLQHQIDKKFHSRSRRFWPLGIAASLLLIVASVYFLQRSENAAQHNLALQKPEQSSPEKSADTFAAAREKNLQEAQKADEPQEESAKEALRAAPEEQPTGATVSDSKAEIILDQVRDEEPAAAPTLADAQTEAATTLSEAERTSRAKSAQPATALMKKRREISGRVTSSSTGSGVKGANVIVSGTHEGTVADDSGVFVLHTDQEPTTVSISSIGMRPLQYNIQPNQTKADVELSPAKDQVSEMEVAGNKLSEDKKSFSPISTYLAGPDGGRKAFQQYLIDHVQYPADALEQKIEGDVIAEFVIMPSGELRDFTIVKGIGFGCDEELIRLIKNGPSWSPTRQNGTPIEDKVRILFRFKLPR